MSRVLFSTCLFKATEIAAYVNTHRYKLALATTEALREMIRQIPQAPEFERTAHPVAAVRALVAQAEAGSVGGMTLQAAELHSLLERIVANGHEMALEARQNEATLTERAGVEG
ncbi:MAG: hypothetical protein IMZ69_04950 [Spirochaetes bacterium]|nr:hypothetical protein [Spirochaetota bacterium]